MDAGLDENQAEFGVLVLAVSDALVRVTESEIDYRFTVPVALEMLADGDGLLDQHVEVLWDPRNCQYVHSVMGEEQ